MRPRTILPLILLLSCLFSTSIPCNATSMGSSSSVAPQIVWQKQFAYGNFAVSYAHNSMIQTSDGGYVMAGSSGYLPAVGEFIWLVKFDVDGNQQWNRQQITSGEVNSLVQTPDGGYAIGDGPALIS